MSNKLHFSTMHRSRDVKVVAGAFKPNGASAIDNAVNVGTGWTVSRTGAGAYTILIDCQFYKLLSASFMLSETGASTGYSIKVMSLPVTDTVAGTTSVLITYYKNTAGTFAATDLAAATDTWIYFELGFKDSTVR
jgi:hypothetical protein